MDGVDLIFILSAPLGGVVLKVKVVLAITRLFFQKQNGTPLASAYAALGAVWAVLRRST